MCGIAGIYNNDPGNNVSADVLHKMCDAIVHRGPDEAGYFLEEGLALGHRRLSIIDISSGQQPMVTADKRFALVFNGEIYNYRDIREELQQEGVSFRTSSDTEVILLGWAHWGVEIVERLAGMFAFAIWDKQQHTCHLVRDRLGIKPLFFSLENGSCLFGSELKTIVSVKKDLSINLPAVEDYFTFGYIPEPKTIYRGIQKLEPGHYLVLKPDGIEKHQYWDIDFTPKHKEGKGLDSMFSEQLESSIVSHLESEVPLGAFLSGGVDSSTVVAIMANHGDSPVNTCSIGFESKEYDETQWAEKVATRYASEHRKKIISTDDYDLLNTLSKLYDEPYADASALPTYRVCQLARENVTVCISGDGADEILGGYRRYKLHLMEEKIRSKLPSSFRRLLFGPLGRLYPKLDWAPQFLRAKTTLLALSWDSAEAYYNSVSFLPSWLRANLYSDDFKKQLDGYTSLEVFRHHEANYKGAHDPLSLIQYLDIKTYLVGDILTKVDRASMAHSLEVRVPFLDHHFVEWCAGLPFESKINNGQGKAILKRVMGPHLPSEILYRNKRGFSVPLAQWFRGPLKEEMHDQLTSREFSELGLFDNDFITKSIAQHVSGKGDHSTLIWTLLMFSFFIKNSEVSI